MSRHDSDDDDDDDIEGALDPLVRIARRDPESAFYDPRYAQPIPSWRPSSGPQGGGWGEVDGSLLDDRRAPVPAFPLEVLPSFWRDWVGRTAEAAGAPVDYVALSLIAAVAGLCGAGVRVQVAPGWQEPVVLWQALVGAPSSGKSPAIAPVRRLLATLARERAGATASGTASGTASETGGEAPAVGDGSMLSGLDEAVAADGRSLLLWCDEPADWLARLAAASGAARTELLRAWSPETAGGASAPAAIGLLACLPPDLVTPLAALGDALAARFLFAWPLPPPPCPLAGRRAAADDEALAALRRLLPVGGPPEAPTVLVLDDDALPPLDAFLAALHAELAEAEGLDQAWQGKGRGVVVRLAGCLALLDGSGGGAADGSVAPSRVVGRAPVEQAIVLWRDYLRPHARAVLQLARPDAVDRKARQVVRWLKAGAVTTFSREDIRCDALGRSVNAARTDQILYRLQAAGIVKQVVYSLPSRGGRPPNRWEVNPRLNAAGNAGNTGNPTALSVAP